MGFCARIVAFCASMLIFIFPGVAATVCVLVVESGLPIDSTQIEASSAWEAGLMDAFFDAGHIVYNGNLLRSIDGPNGEGPVLPETGFGAEAAKAGGAEYLVLAVLDYGKGKDESALASRPSPSGVAFRLMDLGSGLVLTEGLEVSLPKTISGEEEAREAGKFARLMMKDLKER